MSLKNIDYVPINHPNITQLLDSLSGVKVTQAWLDELKDGDTEKFELWQEVLERRNISGYPYILFVDHM